MCICNHFEVDPVKLRLFAPIVGIRYQRKFLILRVGLQHPRTCTYRLRKYTGHAAVILNGSRAQETVWAGIGLFNQNGVGSIGISNCNRVIVNNFDIVHGIGRKGAEAAIVDPALQIKFNSLCIEIGAVREFHALPQMVGVGLAIVRNIPACGQNRRQRSVSVILYKPFIDHLVQEMGTVIGRGVQFLHGAVLIDGHCDFLCPSCIAGALPIGILSAGAQQRRKAKQRRQNRNSSLFHFSSSVFFCCFI